MKWKRRNVLCIPLDSMHKCAFISVALVAIGAGWTYLRGHAEFVFVWLIPGFVAGAWAIAAASDMSDNHRQ